jgi:hypothetical protein
MRAKFFLMPSERLDTLALVPRPEFGFEQFNVGVFTPNREHCSVHGLLPSDWAGAGA